MILFLFGFLYVVLNAFIFILKYTYYNFNIWLTIVINISLLISLIYFIDKFVKKLDKND